jgi:hypothetical protein
MLYAWVWMLIWVQWWEWMFTCRILLTHHHHSEILVSMDDPWWTYIVMMKIQLWWKYIGIIIIILYFKTKKHPAMKTWAFHTSQASEKITLG